MFVMIVVSLIMLDFFIHDTAVAKCTAFKIAMMAEIKSGKENENSKENNNLEKSGTDYLKDKTIALNKLEISIEEEKNKVTVSCEGKSGPLIARILNKKSIGTSSSVKKSAPDDFIRMVNAVRNALE